MKIKLNRPMCFLTKISLLFSCQEISQNKPYTYSNVIIQSENPHLKRSKNILEKLEDLIFSSTEIIDVNQIREVIKIDVNQIRGVVIQINKNTNHIDLLKSQIHSVGFKKAINSEKEWEKEKKYDEIIQLTTIFGNKLLNQTSALNHYDKISAFGAVLNISDFEINENHLICLRGFYKGEKISIDNEIISEVKNLIQASKDFYFEFSLRNLQKLEYLISQLKNKEVSSLTKYAINTAECIIENYKLIKSNSWFDKKSKREKADFIKLHAKPYKEGFQLAIAFFNAIENKNLQEAMKILSNLEVKYKVSKNREEEKFYPYISDLYKFIYSKKLKQFLNLIRKFEIEVSNALFGPL